MVSVIVHLENKGQTRISARRYQDIKSGKSDFLYYDELDQCKHAGTLKIRRVPEKHKSELFDWYSLQPITKVNLLEYGRESREGDLEQINYLNEYQDPEMDFKDVDFWMEPNEKYDLQIMISLQPATYVMKAYFLGDLTKYQDEEYWSYTRLFDLK